MRTINDIYNKQTMTVRRVILLLTALPFLGILKGNAASIPTDTVGMERMTFHFQAGRSMLLKDYRNNAASLEKMRQLFSALRPESYDSIFIVGCASPDGNKTFNDSLAIARAREVRMIVHWKHPEVIRERISIDYKTFRWEELGRMIAVDHHIANKEVMLPLLTGTHPDWEVQAKLRKLSGGSTWQYLSKNYLRDMRSGAVEVMIKRPETPQPVAEKSTLPIAVVSDTASSDTIFRQPTDLLKETLLPTVPLEKPARDYVLRPLLALKTNLLFDLGSMLNVELEVSLGKRYSIAAEWIFPWWLWEDKQHCLQLLSGTAEGRYWFGNRQQHDLLTGWFAGVYAGGGYYDLEWDHEGYQGEFFIALGLSGGFSHRIARNLRMEYSLGIGYMQTDYRRYEALLESDQKWHLYRRENGRYSWIGPTRAKISLVWMLNYKQPKGGGTKP